MEFEINLRKEKVVVGGVLFVLLLFVGLVSAGWTEGTPMHQRIYVEEIGSIDGGNIEIIGTPLYAFDVTIASQGGSALARCFADKTCGCQTSNSFITKINKEASSVSCMPAFPEKR